MNCLSFFLVIGCLRPSGFAHHDKAVKEDLVSRNWKAPDPSSIHFLERQGTDRDGLGVVLLLMVMWLMVVSLHFIQDL